MNYELTWRVFVMNPRYIFAVSCHNLLHGGLGHRPLPYEELVLLVSYCLLFANLLFLWETHSILAFIEFASCKLSVKYHPSLWNLSQAPSCPKTCSSCHMHVHHHKLASLSNGGPETPVYQTGYSGLTKVSALSNGDSGTPETPAA